MPDRPDRFTRPCYFAGVLGMLFLLGGCVPVLETYHYISLETYEDARVIRRARPTPGEFRLSVGEIPIRYEITRESHTLRLEIDPDISTPVRPAMAIRVQPARDRSFTIEPTQEKGPPGCGDWATRSDPPLPARLEWVHRSDCDPPNGSSGFRIRFHVVNREGIVVDEETIPYTVKKDGFHLFYDAV